MTLYGLMMVRNEADLLRANLAYHLAAGVDAFLIVDNGSSDGTTEILGQLAIDPRVAWTRWDGPYRQSEVTTALAREAYLRGADWVVPIDADEFWWTEGGDLEAPLRNLDGGAIEAVVVNFVQRRGQVETAGDALLHMTRRVPRVSGDWEGDKTRVARGEIGFVEITYPPKWIARATPTLQIGMGNHEIAGTAGPKIKSVEVLCLHAPLRSRAALEAKIVDHGVRARELGLEGDLWWQARRWGGLDVHQALASEWAANSYGGEGLEVEGAIHPVVEDPKLAESVGPWLRKEARWPAPRREATIVRAPFHLTENRGRLRVDLDLVARDATTSVLAARAERSYGAVEYLLEELADRAGQINARLGDIDYLRAELGQRDDGIAYQRSELAQRDQTIASVTGELDHREKEIAHLRSELDQREEGIAHLRSELDQRDRSAGWAALQAERAEALAREVESLRCSLSWKLTAPLRAVARRLQHLRR